MFRHMRISLTAGLVPALLLEAASAQAASEHRFSFRAVEFLPAEERVLAAEHFIASNIRPGMPLALAERVIGKADAHCRPHADPTAPILCTYSVTNQRPGLDPHRPDDVVEPFAGPDATVAGASVSRGRYGF